MALNLTPSTRLLFIGDSITDCGWKNDGEKIGNGFVRLVRDLLRVRHMTNAPEVINRGISGNKVTDLARRWERDVVELRPDVVSVYIGINDVWHTMVEGRSGVPLEEFMPAYRQILTRTREALPACRIVLCEPSVIWPPQDARLNPALAPYVKAVHELAGEFAVQDVVRLNEAFERARKARPDIAWAPDGVHPSASGHMLIAMTWLETLKLI